MRKTQILATLFWTASSIAQNWTALPPIPVSRASGVSGDGTRLVVYDGLGGMQKRYWNGAWAEGSRLGAANVSMVGDQTVFTNPEGLYYDPLSIGLLRRAALPVTGTAIAFDQDGSSIVAVVASSQNSSDSYRMFRSIDSQVPTPPMARVTETSAQWHGWREIKHPGIVASDWGYSTRAWIQRRIVVATESGKTWISRDTGRTWSDSLPGLTYAAAISGDTIVLRNGYTRLLVSRNAGAKWDTLPAQSWWDASELAVRGGRLFQRVWGQDTIPLLLRSADWGATWDTVFRRVTNPGLVAWDGDKFWSRKDGDLVRFARDGRDLEIVDTLVAPIGVARKIVGFGKALLVLQFANMDDQDETGRLWSYSGGAWTLLRDRVNDVEVMRTDSGMAVFVLVDPAAKWYRYWWLGRGLERSYDLRSWMQLPEISPQVSSFGRDPRGLLMGDTSGMLVLTPGRSILRAAAWNSYPYNPKNLAAENGTMIWSESNAFHSRTAGGKDTIKYASNRTLGSFTTTGNRYGFLCSAEGNWRTVDQVPVKTASWGLPGQVCGADRYRGDTLAMWQGGYGMSLIGPASDRSLYGPTNVRIVRGAWIPAQALSSTASATDSAFVLADLVGGLYTSADLVAGTDARSNSGRQILASRVAGGLRIELATAVEVEVDVVDLEGRKLSESREVPLRPGSNLVALEPVVSPGFALVRMDGKIAASVRIAPFSR